MTGQLLLAHGSSLNADPYLDRVTLVLHADGSNGSTNIIDGSLYGQVPQANTGVAVSTTQAKFGSSSFYVGAGKYVAYPGGKFDFGADDFTVECFVYPNSTSDWQGLVGRRDGSVYTPFSLELSNVGAPMFVASFTGTSWSVSITGSTPVSLNTWTHLAAVRRGFSWFLFMNGVLQGTAVAYGSLVADAQRLVVGGNGTGVYCLNGYLDDVRITHGVARYTKAFTVQSLAFRSRSLEDTSFNQVSLLMHFDGTNGSTTITDTSLSARTVTSTNATLSNTQSKFGGTSLYLTGGSSSYLTIPNSADLAVGGSDFTIEFWAYPLDMTGPARVLSYGEHGGSLWPVFEIGVSGGLIGLTVNYQNANTYQTLLSTVTLALSTWVHVAFVRSGNVFTIYLDGVARGTMTWANSVLATSQPMYIGGYLVFGVVNYGFNGYLDDFRFTKGVARYTANFSVPTARFPDYSVPALNDLNTSLLIHANGVNGATAFVDSSPRTKTITANGNAQISTTQSKFGGSSAYFDGGGDYLSIPTSTDFDLGTTYTIDYWVYSTTAGIGYMGIGNYTNPGSTWTGLVFCVRNQYVYWYGTTVGDEQRSDLTGIPFNQWVHVALVREGTVGRIYLNGVLFHTKTGLSTNAVSTMPLKIGLFDYNVAPEYFRGYIDEFRVTKGLAVYTSGFTPPTSAFKLDSLQLLSGADPYFSYVTLLLHNSPVEFSSFQKSISMVGTLTSSAAQSKFGGSSLYVDGSGDYLTVSPVLTFDTLDFTIECWVYQSAASGGGPILSNRAGTSGYIFQAAKIAGSWQLFWQQWGPPSYIYEESAFSTAADPGWTHVAVCRVGNAIQGFVNGVSVGTFTSAVRPGLPAAACGIGKDIGDVSAATSTFYLQDLRVTQGIARYTGAFTPPTAPFPNY